MNRLLLLLVFIGIIVSGHIYSAEAKEELPTNCCVHMPELEPADDYLYFWKGLDFREVQQSEIFYHTSLDKRYGKILVSQGAGPCVIFAARNRQSGAGFIAHIFIHREIDPRFASGKQVLKRLNETINMHFENHSSEEDVIDYYIVGGWQHFTPYLRDSINNFIDEASEHIRPLGIIYNQAMTEDSLTEKSFLLDMRDGQFYLYDKGRLSSDYRRDLNNCQAFFMTITFINSFFPWLYEVR